MSVTRQWSLSYGGLSVTCFGSVLHDRAQCYIWEVSVKGQLYDSCPCYITGSVLCDRDQCYMIELTVI